MEVVENTAYEHLRQRKLSYQQILESPAGQNILNDLAKFCRAHDSTFHPDPRVAAMLDGRREVWLRLQHHLKLDLDTLWGLYGSSK